MTVASRGSWPTAMMHQLILVLCCFYFIFVFRLWPCFFLQLMPSMIQSPAEPGWDGLYMAVSVRQRCGASFSARTMGVVLVLPFARTSSLGCRSFVSKRKQKPSTSLVCGCSVFRSGGEVSARMSLRPVPRPFRQNVSTFSQGSRRT